MLDSKVDRIASRILSDDLYWKLTLATRGLRPAQVSNQERYTTDILEPLQGNAVITEAITTGVPHMASRFGAYELMACSFFWRNQNKGTDAPVKRAWPCVIGVPLFRNAGVFPPTDDVFCRFVEVYRRDVAIMDALAVWFRQDEHLIWRDWLPNAKPIAFASLTPMDLPMPWTHSLAGKRVLVVHPFEKSIRAQYEKRLLLFNGREFLPDFELLTLPAVQAIGGRVQGEFKDWFEALQFMCEKISKIDFDVALIGAGAFGLPLAAEVKRMGKVGLHIGGALQLFFGIKGKRWDSRGLENLGANEHWVRPLPEETPREAADVEQACYW